jgi:hypothetical protein
MNFLYIIFFLIAGTGSNPPSQKGLHRIILLKARKDPLKKPYISIA